LLKLLLVFFSMAPTNMCDAGGIGEATLFRKDSDSQTFKIHGNSFTIQRKMSQTTRSDEGIDNRVIIRSAVAAAVADDSPTEDFIKRKCRRRPDQIITDHESADAGMQSIKRFSSSKRAASLPSHSLLEKKRGALMMPPGERSNTSSEACYGFLPGEWVSTSDGSDADGPWRDMGNGIVLGASSARPGLLDIEFENGDRYAIRAKNLTKGSSPDFACRDKNDSTSGTFVENDVVWFEDAQGIGTVVGPGPNKGMLFVRFDGIGVRTVLSKKCHKINKKSPGAEDAQVAVELNIDNPWKAKALFLDAVAKNIHKKAAWFEFAMGKDQEAAFANLQACRVAGLAMKDKVQDRVGARVKANRSPWKELGVGVVRDMKSQDTALVQFDIKGDLWSLSWKDLDIVEDKDSVELGHRRRKHFDRPLRW